MQSGTERIKKMAKDENLTICERFINPSKYDLMDDLHVFLSYTAYNLTKKARAHVSLARAFLYCSPYLLAATLSISLTL